MNPPPPPVCKSPVANSGGERATEAPSPRRPAYTRLQSCLDWSTLRQIALVGSEQPARNTLVPGWGDGGLTATGGAGDARWAADAGQARLPH